MHICKIFSSHKSLYMYMGAAVLLLVSVALSLLVGAIEIDLLAAVRDIAGGSMGVDARIFLYSRLPRTLAPLLAGAAFSVSGMLIQGVLNNALASPNIIGVNSGAGLFCVLTAALLPAQPGLIPVMSFLGAFLAVMLVYFVGLKTGASRLTLVLSGIAVGTTLSAFTNAVNTFYPNVISGTASFFVGGFSSVALSDLGPAWIFILLGLAASFLLITPLNVLMLGEDSAAGLGLRVQSVRFFAILLASILAGAAVSFSGLLGFVGLAVPHITRRIFGTDHRHLLPGSIMFGAAFLTFCDTLARILFAPFELPVGILTSLIGGPFFVFLLTQKRRGRLHD